jgi:RHH-type transcriptional regulator, rel operon repressor / antitoxin RelB
MSRPTADMTVQLPLEIKEGLEELARTMERSEALLIVEAVASYVDLQQWQLREIEKGLQEADAGDFATDEEVAAIVAKWTNAR